MNIDVSKIKAAITSKTKAIMPVHFAGRACEMDEILALAKHYNLKVIEDAAHALPTRYKGKLIGQLDSDATVYSFYATKTMTTGEGGMIVSKHTDIIERCKPMRLHGISRDVFDRYTSTKAGWYYEIACDGYKSNMTDMAASLGVVQLRKVWSFREKRAAIATKYRQAFKHLPFVLPQDTGEQNLHAWHLFPILLKDELGERGAWIDRLKQTFDIGCSVHFIPLHHHPFWQKTLGVAPGDFPVADDVFAREVSLPIYTKMTDDQVDRVIKAVTHICG